MLSWIGSRPVAAACEDAPAWRGFFGRIVRPVAAAWVVVFAVELARGAASSARGLPFTRSYSFEDIGNVPRGSRLGFDRFGRVAVIHDAIYAVLNDSVWLNLAEEGSKARIPMSNVVHAPDGRAYYGARGSWGYVEDGADGRLHPVPLVPAEVPGWIATAAFEDIIVTRDGVYFGSWNGVVFWDFERQRSLLFGLPGRTHMFQVGERVYLSGYGSPLRYIDLETETVRLAAGTELDRSVVEYSTILDESRALLAYVDGRLVVFDGQRVSPWLTPEMNTIRGDISALERLVDDRVAIGVTGQGLLLFSAGGELLMALTTPQYSNIAALANREPGVLWVETEHAIEKILYGSPLSGFGQRLGVPLGWPIVASWNGRIYVASDGKLYRAIEGERGEPTRFEATADQPAGGAWALAAWGERMLVGSGSGLYSVQPDGTFQPLPSVAGLAHLVMVGENRCFVVGRTEIALLEWRGGRWIEPHPRIAGVGNPAIVHRIGGSVWIEMGGDGVARLWANEGGIQLDVVPNQSWTKGSWANIGAVGDIVVLSAMREEPRRFFDQKSGTWCEAPELQQLFDRSPYWIARMQRDESGVIWATHNEGLIRFAPGRGGYDMDVNSFDLVNDRYPVVRILPGDDVWLAAKSSLYHIERTWISSPQTPRPEPVSLVDLHRNEELLAAAGPDPAPLRLPYARNSLSFRFFSGTDAWHRAPAYEYRLAESEPWTMFDGSLLTLRGLREGSYRLQVRLAAVHTGADAPAAFAFEIEPPWHRSWPAYVLFATAALVVLIGGMRWASYLERRRNRMLEQVVQERTHQLESAMAKLGEETRHAATLAERDRLANEIHDSVQQGLTGAMLQLDTTLKLPVLGSDVRSRLNVVRNMISYARQEVEHAVWDMESPLLDGTDLADALRNLTAFVNSGEVGVDISVSGNVVPLGRTISHNLLRIVQEATTNAFRHATARWISIRLQYAPEAVSLEIADDGVGFRPGEVLHGTGAHFGLQGMRARAKKLHGTLTVISAPGEGTTVRVVVPTGGSQKLFRHAEAQCI